MNDTHNETNGSGWLNDNKSKLDFFRNHQELATDAASEKELTQDVRLITDDGTKFHLPGISYFLSPKDWENVNLNEELNALISDLETPPRTHSEFVLEAHKETPQAKKVVDTLEGLTLMSSTLSYISNNVDHVLNQFKNENLLTPTQTLNSYSAILEKNKEHLEQFFKFDLTLSKEEMSKSSNLALLGNTPDLSNFIKKAHTQNEEVVLNTIKYNPEKLTSLLRNVNADELSDYPKLIGPIMYSTEAFKFNENSLNELSRTALHTYLSKKVKAHLSSTSNAKQMAAIQSSFITFTQALSSIATNNYNSMSTAMKQNALDHLNGLLNTSQRDSINFQKRINDIFSDLDNKSLFQEFTNDLVKSLTPSTASHMPDDIHTKVNQVNGRIDFAVEHPDVDPSEIPANTMRGSSPVIHR